MKPILVCSLASAVLPAGANASAAASPTAMNMRWSRSVLFMSLSLSCFPLVFSVVFTWVARLAAMSMPTRHLPQRRLISNAVFAEHAPAEHDTAFGRTDPLHRYLLCRGATTGTMHHAISRISHPDQGGGAIMDPLVVQHLVNWLTLGSIYALVALGFSLLFGVLNVIHFSHGDVSMVAPFIVLGVISALYGSVMPADMPGLVLAVVIALVATGALGILLDRLVIRRFRDSPAMMALVATVALGTVLRELIRTLYPQGSNPKPFPRFISGHVSIGELSLSSYSLFVIIVSALAMFALFWMMRNTQLGLRIRAVSEDRSAARLMAIDPNRVFAATFFIASAVGAIGGVFFASYAGVVRFDFGIMYGLLG